MERLIRPDSWADRMTRALHERDQVNYVGSCVELDGEKLEAMKDLETELTYDEFAEKVDLEPFCRVFGYEKTPNQGLTLKNDWHVTYAKSWYDGNPVYFLTHSAIEYVWRVQW